jgi:hypothetical protein
MTDFLDTAAQAVATVDNCKVGACVCVGRGVALGLVVIWWWLLAMCRLHKMVLLAGLRLAVARVDICQMGGWVWEGGLGWLPGWFWWVLGQLMH